MRSIESEFYGQSEIYGRPYLVLYLNIIVIGHHSLCGTVTRRPVSTH